MNFLHGKLFIIELLQYAVLIAVISISAIWLSNTVDVYYRFLILTLDAVIYFFWGLWHHHSKGRLTNYILVEYGTVSIFIIFLAALGLGIIRFF